MIITLVSLILVSNTALAIYNFSANFERESFGDTHQKREIISGSIYYQLNERTIIKVHEPIEQTLVFQNSSLQIYYPKQQKSITLNANTSFPMRFIYNFIGSMKDDFGLSEIGYELKDHAFNDGILTSIWELENDKEEKEANFVFTLVKKDKMVLSTKSRDPKGELLVNTTFKNHFNFGNHTFPRTIITKFEKNNKSSTETVNFSKIKFNTKFPQNIIDFEIPNTTDSKTINMN